MRMRTIAALAALMAVAGAGCGSSSSERESISPPAQPSPPPPAPTKLAISWNDGNPLVPVCPVTQPSNCKNGYTVLDQTTGVIVATLPVTTMSYLAPDASHQYAVEAIGYDWQGNSISSPAIPVAQTQ